ncbi:DUF2971 domain-containing protein [Flavobacterium antarcticum]|uniref:DUF2971 domain-containing protein n=1 Tax=Flavobacterium antarcticum TaxID=271155 RepID=UPI0003B54DA3|nr:DUF2971 domain-containing protein [Flavobacterium antarcticum]
MRKISFSEILESGISSGQVSQYLYKYRTIDSLKKILENDSLWFSSPQDFNDPFDCQIVPDTNNTEEEIIEFLKSNAPEGTSEESISSLALKIFNNPEIWKKTIEGVFRDVINATGVCCFTANETNLLMWSHYTDSHKGVCLKFDITKDPEYFAYPLEVKYTTDYPAYNHLTNLGEIVNLVALSKSIAWEYEAEIRVLRPEQNGLIPFNKNALVEIIFGCNSSENSIKEITELVNKNLYQVKFKKAKRKQREFGLTITDL